MLMLMSVAGMALLSAAQVNSDTKDLTVYATNAVNYTCGTNDKITYENVRIT